MIDWSGIFSTSGQTLIYRLAAVAVIIAIHGFAVALAAVVLGDRGPLHDRRLTLNPFQHLEPIGTVVPLFFRMGWIKPIRIAPENLRGGRAGLVTIAAAGLMLTLLAGVAAWRLRPVLLSLSSADTVMLATVGILEHISDLSLWFVAINLLPIPPLTGGLVLAAIHPGLHGALLRRTSIIALGLALLIATGLPQQALGPLVATLRQALLL